MYMCICLGILAKKENDKILPYLDLSNDWEPDCEVTETNHYSYWTYNRHCLTHLQVVLEKVSSKGNIYCIPTLVFAALLVTYFLDSVRKMCLILPIA